MAYTYVLPTYLYIYIIKTVGRWYVSSSQVSDLLAGISNRRAGDNMNSSVVHVVGSLLNVVYISKQSPSNEGHCVISNSNHLLALLSKQLFVVGRDLDNECSTLKQLIPDIEPRLCNSAGER